MAVPKRQYQTAILEEPTFSVSPSGIAELQNGAECRHSFFGWYRVDSCQCSAWYPSPPLLPSDRIGRQRVRSIALDFAADHHPLIVPRIRRYLADHLEAGPDQVKEWICHWFGAGLNSAETRLAADQETGKFCHGSSPTIADIALISHVMAARGFQITTEGLPVIHRIAEACLANDAFARAVPLRQYGAPTAH